MTPNNPEQNKPEPTESWEGERTTEEPVVGLTRMVVPQGEGLKLKSDGRYRKYFGTHHKNPPHE